MSHLLEPTLLICLSAIASWFVLRILSGILPNAFLAAEKSERSNHVLPARQIGGLAVVPVAVLFAVLWAILAVASVSTDLLVILPLVFISLVGFWDDYKGLNAYSRLVLQLLSATTISLLFVPDLVESLGGYPHFLILGAGIIFLVYMTNITNFMDGIDWMMVSGFAVPIVYSAMTLFYLQGSSTLFTLALATGGALLGFAIHNRPPAKIFLGDSGSLFCGLLAGVLILAASFLVSPVIALLPFSYFLLDATSTIVLRLYQGKNIFKAHSEHAYQIAFRAGKSAQYIAGRVLILSLFLCLLSFIALFFSTFSQSLFLAAGWSMTAIMIMRFRKQL